MPVRAPPTLWSANFSGSSSEIAAKLFFWHQADKTGAGYRVTDSQRRKSTHSSRIPSWPHQAAHPAPLPDHRGNEPPKLAYTTSGSTSILDVKGEQETQAFSPEILFLSSRCVTAPWYSRRISPAGCLGTRPGPGPDTNHPISVVGGSGPEESLPITARLLFQSVRSYTRVL